MNAEGPLEGGGADDDSIAPSIIDIDAKLAEIRRTAQRYAAMMLSADDAEDVAQEIVIWAWEKLRAEPGSIDFSRPLTPLVFSWVGTRVGNRMDSEDARVARNVAYNDDRLDVIPLHQDPIAALAGREPGRVVSECLRTMPPARREVYVAIHDRGEPYADVARRRGISKQTVHAHHKLAQVAVRAAVSRYQDTGR
jgi:RNA polymerase sigma-70 factor (ECF subfamily)